MSRQDVGAVPTVWKLGFRVGAIPTPLVLR